MTEKEAKNRIIELSEQIREHNYNYYIKANSAISDYDFDQLLKELEALEKECPEFAFEMTFENYQWIKPLIWWNNK